MRNIRQFNTMKAGRIFITIILSFLSVGLFAQHKSKSKVVKGYDAIYPFKNGKAKVEKGGKVGYINVSGEEFIPCKYDAIYPFEMGKAKVERNGKFGFINEAGEEVIEPKFDYIGPFKNGRAIVRYDGKLEVIDTEGNVLTEGNHGAPTQ